MGLIQAIHNELPGHLSIREVKQSEPAKVGYFNGLLAHRLSVSCHLSVERLVVQTQVK